MSSWLKRQQPTKLYQASLLPGYEAKNGARAVIHEHEIGREDFQFLAFDKRMTNGQAGIEAFLFGLLDGRLAGAQLIALGNEVFQAGAGRSYSKYTVRPGFTGGHAHRRW